MNDAEAIACISGGGKVRRPHWPHKEYLFLRNGQVWSCIGSGPDISYGLSPEEFFHHGFEWEAIAYQSQYNPIRKVVRRLDL